MLKLRFDVSQYTPEEIVVKTVDNKLLVSGNATVKIQPGKLDDKPIGSFAERIIKVTKKDVENTQFFFILIFRPSEI